MHKYTIRLRKVAQVWQQWDMPTKKQNLLPNASSQSNSLFIVSQNKWVILLSVKLNRFQCYKHVIGQIIPKFCNEHYPTRNYKPNGQPTQWPTSLET